MVLSPEPCDDRAEHVTVAVGRFDALTGRGLVQLLREDRDLRIIGTDLDEAALEQIAAQQAPLVVILDETSAVESRALERLRAVQPTIGIVVMVYEPTVAYGRRLLARGASCLSKRLSGADILAAVHLTADDRRVFTDVDDRLVERGISAAAAASLTQREVEVLECLSMGLSNGEAAHDLHLSVETIRTHSAHIRAKLGVRSKRELIGIKIPIPALQKTHKRGRPPRRGVPRHRLLITPFEGCARRRAILRFVTTDPRPSKIPWRFCLNMQLKALKVLAAVSGWNVHGEDQKVSRYPRRPSHGRAVKRACSLPEQRRIEHVRILLAGGLVNTAELGYRLDSWHLGIVGAGMGVGQTVRAAVAGLDCEVLCVQHDEDSLWAWLGGQRKAVAGVIERLMARRWPAGVTLAIGEPREGVDGWRSTHREAQAALLVARLKPQNLIRCADVVLEAALLRDATLARTLKDVYLSPLDDLRIGGHVARETLRAHFATGHGMRAAAGRLGVDRRTVWHRLGKITAKLGWSPEERRAELEVALRLEALDEKFIQHV